MSLDDLLNIYYDYIYLRKSRKDIEFDNDIDILARHEKQLLELAIKKGINIPPQNILREVVSGENLSERPMMQFLLNKIENGEVKSILCIEIERLSRGNSIDQGIITQAIVMNNVTIHTLQKTYDPKNEYDEEYFEFGLFMSRREYKTINRRLQRGMLQSKKEGKWVSSVDPFGYTRVKLKGEKGFTLTPNEDASTVKLIFELFSEGIKAPTIAKKLSELKLKSATGRTEWNDQMVRNILDNEVYKGYIVLNKRKVIKSIFNNKITLSRPLNNQYELIKGLHQAIIPEELFDKCKKIKEQNSAPKVPINKELKNPFAGLLYCGLCGKAVVRKPGYRKNEQVSVLCRNAHCNNRSATFSLVEERIINTLKDILKEQKIFLDNYEAEYIKKNSNNTNEIKKLEKKIKELDKQFNKTCELLEKGVYSVDLFESRSKSITQEKNALNDLKNRLIEENKKDDTIIIKKRIPILEKCIENYNYLTITEKNELLSALITKIEYTRTDKSNDLNNFNIKITL